MAIKENGQKTYRIYLKSAKEWVDVPEDYYREHTRYYDAFRKKAQYHGQCACPKNKFWLCDGDCFNCEFRRAGDMLSLDYENENEDGDSVSMLDSTPDAAPLVDEIVCDKATLDQLFDRLAGLMPQAEEIGRLRMQNLSDEEIADIIGIRRTTFRSRLSKAKAILAEEYPDFF